MTQKNLEARKSSEILYKECYYMISKNNASVYVLNCLGNFFNLMWRIKKGKNNDFYVERKIYDHILGHFQRYELMLAASDKRMAFIYDQWFISTILYWVSAGRINNIYVLCIKV